MSWKRLPDFGPRQRCSWGGWRCKNTAVWWYEGAGRRTVLCDAHYRTKTEKRGPNPPGSITPPAVDSAPTDRLSA